MAEASGTRSPEHLRGFTLIELMVAITVMAILLTIAVPSFTATINRNRLATAANELVTTIQLARTEAVRRGGRVVVCASADASAANPTCAAGSWQQWIAFLDSNADGQRQAAEPLLRTSKAHAAVVMAAGSALAAAPASQRDRIVFRPDGLSYAHTGALLAEVVNACIETTQPEINGRNVRIRSGSSVVVEDAAPDPDCEAP